MDNFYVRSWTTLALRGLAGIAFGIAALMWPGLTLLSLVALFSVYALVVGFVSAAGAVRHRRSDDDWWVGMLLGLVSVGAGIAAVMSPARSALFVVLLIGANALVSGVLDLVGAVRLRQAVVGEWMLALSGAASALFGVLVFLYPGAGALALSWLIGLYALVTGTLLLAPTLHLRRLALAHGADHEGDRRVQPDQRMSLVP